MVLISAMVLMLFLLGSEWRSIYRVFAAMSLAFGVGALVVRFPPRQPRAYRAARFCAPWLATRFSPG